LPFLLHLALRSLLYLGIILFELIACNLRVGVSRADIAFSLATMICSEFRGRNFKRLAGAN
jgi:hypothetical protein